MNRLIGEQPGIPVFHHIKGQSLVLLSDISGATRAFEKEVRIKPDSAYGWFDLSLCYRAMNDPKRAQWALGRALKINPNLRESDVPFGSVVIEPSH